MKAKTTFAGRDWPALHTIMILPLRPKVKRCVHNHTDCWRTLRCMSIVASRPNRNIVSVSVLCKPRQELSSASDNNPVVGLLVPNDLAAIVTEIVRKSLAAFGYRIAYSTDPSLYSAKSSPRLILLDFGVVGAHDVRKYSSECSVYLPVYGR